MVLGLGCALFAALAYGVAAVPALWAILAHGLLTACSGCCCSPRHCNAGRSPPPPRSRSLSTPVVPAGIGLAFLGDTTRPGYGLVAAAGFVLTITGTLTLATYDAASHDLASAATTGSDQ